MVIPKLHFNRTWRVRNTEPMQSCCLYAITESVFDVFLFSEYKFWSDDMKAVQKSETPVNSRQIIRRDTS
jgi:hypothetical protein